MTYGNPPIEWPAFDPHAEESVAGIRRLVATNPELKANLCDFPIDEQVVKEGAPNHAEYVLLDGMLALFKQMPGSGNVEVSRHGRGELVGGHSFATDNRSFCPAQTVEPASALKLGPALMAIFESAFLLRHLGASAQQISRLVTKLKENARPASAAREIVDIRESIESTFAVLNPLINRHELHAELDLGLTVSALATSMTQIWTNLIKNACEAMDDQGVLWVRASRSGDHAVVEISNNGPGIPQDLQKKIFDVNFTTKPGGENFGFGLGLSITRSLVKENDRLLELMDTPGGGCTFRVKFPISWGSIFALSNHALLDNGPFPH